MQPKKSKEKKKHYKPKQKKKIEKKELKNMKLINKQKNRGIDKQLEKLQEKKNTLQPISPNSTDLGPPSHER